MIDASIGTHKFEVISEWSEMTLRQFIELSTMEIPKKLESIYSINPLLSSPDKKERAEAEKKWMELSISITSEEELKIFPAYYGQVIKCLSNISDECLDLLQRQERFNIFTNVLMQFVQSAMFAKPIQMNGDNFEYYEPPEVKSFKIGTDEYFFPKSVDINGSEYLMGEEPIVSFAEASDMEVSIKELEKNGIAGLPLFMAIYCRKQFEKYDETVVLSRQEIFKEVTMDIVWSLFFYTGKLIQESMINLGLFLNHIQGEAKRKHQATLQ